MEQDSLLELTGLASYNQVVREAQGCAWSQPGSTSVLVACVERLDADLGRVAGQIFEAQACRPPTRERDEVLDTVDVALPELHAGITSLVAALEAADDEAFRASLGGMRAAVQVLVEAEQRMRDLDAAEPSYSPSAPVDELCRVGYAFLAGRVSWAAFAQRLQGFEIWTLQLAQGLSMMIPHPSEQAEHELQAPRIAAALDILRDAVVELRAACDAADDRTVGSALEQVREGAAALCEVQDALEQAAQRAGRVPCVRCGHLNPNDARHCGRCQAALLRLSHLEAVSAQLDVCDQPAASSRVPSHVQELLDALASWEAGQASLTALLAAIELLDSRASATTAMLGRMPTPPAELPAEQLELYQQAREALEDGTSALRSALGELKGAAHHGLHREIEPLVEDLMRAVERILLVDTLYEQCLQLNASPGG